MGQSYTETKLGPLTLMITKSSSEAGVAQYEVSLRVQLLDQNGADLRIYQRPQFLSDLPPAKQAQLKDLLDAIDSEVAQRLSVSGVV